MSNPDARRSPAHPDYSHVDAAMDWADCERRIRERDAAAPSNCERSGPWRRALGFCPACGGGELALDGDGRLCCNTAGKCPEPRAIDKELRGRFYERKSAAETAVAVEECCAPNEHAFVPLHPDSPSNKLYCQKCGVGRRAEY